MKIDRVKLKHRLWPTKGFVVTVVRGESSEIAYEGEDVAAANAAYRRFMDEMNAQSAPTTEEAKQRRALHDSMSDRIFAADTVEGPSAWIQWKGTKVCMEVHCSCGAGGHVDADFAYFYRCSACKRIWWVGATIRLHELTPEEQALVVSENMALVTDNDAVPDD